MAPTTQNLFSAASSIGPFRHDQRRENPPVIDSTRPRTHNSQPDVPSSSPSSSSPPYRSVPPLPLSSSPPPGFPSTPSPQKRSNRAHISSSPPSSPVKQSSNRPVSEIDLELGLNLRVELGRDNDGTDGARAESYRDAVEASSAREIPEQSQMGGEMVLVGHGLLEDRRRRKARFNSPKASLSPASSFNQDYPEKQGDGDGQMKSSPDCLPSDLINAIAHARGERVVKALPSPSPPKDNGSGKPSSSTRPAYPYNEETPLKHRGTPITHPFDTPSPTSFSVAGNPSFSQPGSTKSVSTYYSPTFSGSSSYSYHNNAPYDDLNRPGNPIGTSLGQKASTTPPYLTSNSSSSPSFGSTRPPSSRKFVFKSPLLPKVPPGTPLNGNNGIADVEGIGKGKAKVRVSDGPVIDLKVYGKEMERLGLKSAADIQWGSPNASPEAPTRDTSGAYRVRDDDMSWKSNEEVSEDPFTGNSGTGHGLFGQSTSAVFSSSSSQAGRFSADSDWSSRTLSRPDAHGMGGGQSNVQTSPTKTHRRHSRSSSLEYVPHLFSMPNSTTAAATATFHSSPIVAARDSRPQGGPRPPVLIVTSATPVLGPQEIRGSGPEGLLGYTTPDDHQVVSNDGGDHGDGDGDGGGDDGPGEGEAQDSQNYFTGLDDTALMDAFDGQ